MCRNNLFPIRWGEMKKTGFCLGGCGQLAVWLGITVESMSKFLPMLAGNVEPLMLV